MTIGDVTRNIAIYQNLPGSDFRENFHKRTVWYKWQLKVNLFQYPCHLITSATNEARLHLRNVANLVYRISLFPASCRGDGSWEQGSNIAGSLRGSIMRGPFKICSNYACRIIMMPSLIIKITFQQQKGINSISKKWWWFLVIFLQVTLSNLKTSARHFQGMPLLSYSSVTTTVVDNVREWYGAI